MSDEEISTSSELDDKLSAECADDDDLCAQSVDLTEWFSSGLTETGSFDLGIIATTSFGSLLDALPVPILMIDSMYRVVFVNQACSRLSPDCEQLQGVPFTTLVPKSRNAEKALWLLRKVFSSRKLHVADGVLEMAARKIWGRLHFSSIRIGRERYVLLVIEDLTGERTRLLLNKRDENHGLKQREGLEKLVARLASDLSAARQRLDLEVKRHGETQAAFAAERQTLEALAEHSAGAMAVIDGHDRFQYLTHGFRDLFGYSADDVPDLVGWFQGLNQECTGDGQTMSAQLAAMGSENAPQPVTWRGKDGTEKHIDVRAISVTGSRLLMICRERDTLGAENAG